MKGCHNASHGSSNTSFFDAKCGIKATINQERNPNTRKKSHKSIVSITDLIEILEESFSLGKEEEELFPAACVRFERICFKSAKSIFSGVEDFEPSPSFFDVLPSLLIGRDGLLDLPFALITRRQTFPFVVTRLPPILNIELFERNAMSGLKDSNDIPI